MPTCQNCRSISMKWALSEGIATHDEGQSRLRNEPEEKNPTAKELVEQTEGMDLLPPHFHGKLIPVRRGSLFAYQHNEPQAFIFDALIRPELVKYPFGLKVVQHFQIYVDVWVIHG